VVRSPMQAGLPAPDDADSKRVAAMKKLIGSLAKPSLVDAELRELEDDHILQVAERKLKKGKDLVELPPEAREGAPSEGGEVVDLMERIRERLRAEPAKAKQPRAKTPRRRSSAARGARLKRSGRRPRARQR
jgi:non-homologous end joining protein Ku